MPSPSGVAMKEGWGDPQQIDWQEIAGQLVDALLANMQYSNLRIPPPLGGWKGGDAIKLYNEAVEKADPNQ